MDIEDHIDVLKSFNGYLDNIISSYETEGYHLDTIVKISNLISNYYNQVNQENYSSDSDSDVEIIDSNKNDNSSDIVNLSDLSEPEEEDDEDKNNLTTDIYLKNFKNGTVDNSNLKIYQNNMKYLHVLENYVDNSNFY